ncbi:hypothetical protein VTN00DRAFT_9966 [Thermoascus crustaceus]|uniref:uncharacterized protein n=1 Tax=Thermoascus crustaceus TaxID=5088 RepID=UPI00374243D3
MTSSLASQPKWLLLAIASGTFAALNGLFAKLTTTDLTTSISRGFSHLLNLPESTDQGVEVLVRATFFALNLLSNITMWALFTRALTASPSTTKVSITNTASNFLVTAILGMIVFGEHVRGLWWLGAAMMGAGCILVGMRDGDREKKGDSSDAGGGDGDDEGGIRVAREHAGDGSAEESVQLLGADESVSESEDEERNDTLGRGGGRMVLMESEEEGK